MGILPVALYRNLLDDLRTELGEEGLKKIESYTGALSDLSPKEAAASSLVKSLLKKLEVENSTLQDSRALLKFLLVNHRCKNWRLDCKTDRDHILIGELKRAVYEFWNPRPGMLPLVDDLESIIRYGKCGPGASVGGLGGDFYTKMFSSPLTSTSHFLYKSYRDYIRSFQDWHDAEVLRKACFGKVSIVEGSRFSFVPKNDEISRTICVEPTLNQFYQLGLAHILELRLESFYGISMAAQQFKNRELARLGSLSLKMPDLTNFVTIDLESASDSLSLPMLRTILPRDFLILLTRLRSHKTWIPGLGWFALDMISTMGNGFTFPLQTMLFASIVLACFRVNGIQPYHPRGKGFGNYGVFGDDIIVPREISDDVFRLLDLLGFVVNQSKTFVEGPFRESCGSDFFLGRNIRGVYVKSLKSPQDRYAVINQLNLFSTRTGIPLPKTVQALLETVKFCPVPRWDNDDAGIKVPLSLAPKTIHRQYQSICYTRYEAEGQKLRIYDSGIWVPRFAKPRLYNPYGLYICFLQRSVNFYSIGVRHNPARYRRKLGVAPYWDATPTTHPLAGWFNWQRWDTAVYLNLFG
jgi:hypothetical protein